jgi:hypothetical protein
MQRKQYVSDSLTRGLPGLLSATDRAECGGNVMPVDELPPISTRTHRLQRRHLLREWERGSTMKQVSADMANQPVKLSDQPIALHLCYGQIGISAVAAAARYQGGAKNPAYAPVAAGSYEDDGVA